MARVAMLIAGPFPSPQGSQVFAGQMAARLAERGHDVHLLTYGQGCEATGKGFTHHRVRRLPGDDAMRSGPTPVKPLLDVLMLARLRKLQATGRIDVVHAHNYEAAVIALAARRRSGVPVVYHSHNLMCDELSTYFHGGLARRLAGAAGRLLDDHVPRRADHTIALCGLSADALRAAGVSEERLSVVPAAADDERWRERTEARRALGISDEAEIVGYCGNLDRYQNLEVLLHAVSLLRRGPTGERVTFLVGTHARDRRFDGLVELRGMSECTRIVEAHDFADARAVIEAADVVALPRRIGAGHPIKLINYMSAGKPIVAAGCGGKYLRNGEEGWVVEDDDPGAMAAALEHCLDDREAAASLGRAARRRFLSELTWNAVLPRIEAVYAGLANGRPRSQDRHAEGGRDR